MSAATQVGYVAGAPRCTTDFTGGCTTSRAAVLDSRRDVWGSWLTGGQRWFVQANGDTPARQPVQREFAGSGRPRGRMLRGVEHAAVSGAVAGLAIAMPVGAIAVLIVGLAARVSLGVGAAAGLGAATADGLYAALAVAGGAVLARFIAPVAGPMRFAGGLVLLGLALLAARDGVKAWRRRAEQRTTANRTGLGTARRAYLGVLGLTLLNPATLAYYAALVVGGQAGARLSVAGAVMFVVAAGGASASWQLLLATAGSALGRFLTGVRGRIVTAGLSSLIMLFFAVELFRSGAVGMR